MPAYNVDKYIEDNLKSYCHIKEKEKLEVLIINDGSTDHTFEIADKYSKQYPECIAVITKKNGGHGSAINYGIKYATGRYFCIVDGDDWVNPQAIDELLAVLEGENRDAVVMNYETVEQATGVRELKRHVYDKKSFGEITFKEINNKNLYIPMASLCIKTKILKEANYHISEKTFYVDEEYCTVGLSKVKSFIYLDISWYCYRVGNTSQSMYMENQIKNIKHKQRVLTKLIQYYHEADLKKDNRIYVKRKIVGLINSITEIMLVENREKKKGRSFIAYLRKQILKQEASFRQITRKNYFIFFILSYIKVSKQILKMYRK